MDAVRLVIPAAIVLVMAGSCFGVVVARAIWADDLKQALRLREIWVQTQAALESRIRYQENELESLRRK